MYKKKEICKLGEEEEFFKLSLKVDIWKLGRNV